MMGSEDDDLPDCPVGFARALIAAAAASVLRYSVILLASYWATTSFLQAIR